MPRDYEIFSDFMSKSEAGWISLPCNEVQNVVFNDEILEISPYL